MKIFSIAGARPQFIKLAPLSSALSAVHEEIIVHTGQHYDFEMSEKMFLDLGIRNPDIHLEIQKDSSGDQVKEMIVKLVREMRRHKPDVVIVFGDTNSTLAGAMAAGEMRIPLVHIEAGLRSFNNKMPEEKNRITADHIAKYLFAPTKTAVENLHNEGLASNTYLTGDIMTDTLKINLERALVNSAITETLKLDENKYNVLTLHRNYNVDDGYILSHILKQLGALGDRIIFPVHPRTRKKFIANNDIPENITITEPLGYLDFITLEHYSKRIITDSGGIQKEAYLLRKPCITLRTETEWVETVNEKWNVLIDPLDEQMASKINSFIPPEKHNELFGNNVTKKMVLIINEIGETISS